MIDQVIFWNGRLWIVIIITAIKRIHEISLVYSHQRLISDPKIQGANSTTRMHYRRVHWHFTLPPLECNNDNKLTTGLHWPPIRFPASVCNLAIVRKRRAAWSVTVHRLPGVYPLLPCGEHMRGSTTVIRLLNHKFECESIAAGETAHGQFLVADTQWTVVSECFALWWLLTPIWVWTYR